MQIKRPLRGEIFFYRVRGYKHALFLSQDIYSLGSDNTNILRILKVWPNLFAARKASLPILIVNKLPIDMFKELHQEHINHLIFQLII